MADIVDYFSGHIALNYDQDVAKVFSSDVLGPMVQKLSALANGGRALEFALGTGRVALPLQAAGTNVDGIEYSEDMIKEFRKKPESHKFNVKQGDMATAAMGQSYALVYLVFNTIMNLTSQQAQVNCFVNAAKHLQSGGKFLVEVMLPNLRHYPPGALAVPSDVSKEHFCFDTYLTAEQKLISHHFHVAIDGSATYNAHPSRYVWPSELDLMARIAGMKLISRHADWMGTLFDDNSQQHVSVWEKI